MAESTPSTRAMGLAVGMCNRLNMKLNMNRLQDPFWMPTPTLHYVAGKSGIVGSQAPEAFANVTGDADMADAICLFNGSQWVPSVAATGGPVFICKPCESYSEVWSTYSTQGGGLAYLKYMLLNYESGQIVSDDGKSVSNPAFHTQSGTKYDYLSGGIGDNGEATHAILDGYNNHHYTFFEDSFCCSFLSQRYFNYDGFSLIDYTVSLDDYDINLQDRSNRKTIGCSVDDKKRSKIQSLSEAALQSSLRAVISNDGSDSATVYIEVGTTLFKGISDEIIDDDYYSIFSLPGTCLVDNYDCSDVVEISARAALSLFDKFEPSTDGHRWVYPGYTGDSELTPEVYGTTVMPGIVGFESNSEVVLPGTPFCGEPQNSYSDISDIYAERAYGEPEDEEAYNEIEDPGFDYPMIESYEEYYISSNPQIVHLVTARGSVLKNGFGFLSSSDGIKVNAGGKSEYALPSIIITKGVANASMLGLEASANFVLKSFGVSYLGYVNP